MEYVKYHTSGGRLLVCKARIRECTVSQRKEDHLYVPAEITNSDQMWKLLEAKDQASKNQQVMRAKLLATVKTNDKDSQVLWYEMAEEAAYDRNLSAAEQREILQIIFEETSHPEDIMHSFVHSKAFTSAEIDKAFFSLTKDQQESAVYSVFGDWAWDKYARTDKELVRYLPVFNRKVLKDYEKSSLESESVSNYAMNDYVRSVSKYAKKDNTLHRVALTLDSLKFYQYSYCKGYDQEEFLKNPYCSVETAELVLTNLVRSGNTNSFLSAVTSMRERLDGAEADYKERPSMYNAVLEEHKKIKPVAAITGTPDSDITAILQKKDQTYNSSSEHQSLYSVYDSYETNLNRLETVPMLYTSKDKTEVYLSNRARDARLAAALNFRKTVALYWKTLKQLQRQKKNWKMRQNKPGLM